MRKLVGSSIFVVIFSLVPCVQASFSYGTNVQGTSVTYTTIDADSNLWGNMQVSGNALWFFPTQFQSQSVNGDIVPSLDETLQFTMVSKPGGAENRYITSIQFIEYGHYSLFDYIGTGTDLTKAAVTCDLMIQVMEVDRQSVFVAPIYAQLTYTTSDGDYFLVTDGATNQTWWQGSLDVVLADYGFNNVTMVNVSINNLLTVASENGTEARIEKKGFGENPAVMISPIIPEPATLALLGLGAVGLLRKRR